jgi:hypothetical protein
MLSSAVEFRTVGNVQAIPLSQNTKLVTLFCALGGNENKQMRFMMTLKNHGDLFYSSRGLLSYDTV